MEKDAAGCRAFNRNYIVGGDNSAAGKRISEEKERYPDAGP